MFFCGVWDVFVDCGGFVILLWVGVLCSCFCFILIVFSLDMILWRWMVNRDIVEYLEEDFLVFEFLEIFFLCFCVRF